MNFIRCCWLVAAAVVMLAVSQAEAKMRWKKMGVNLDTISVGRSGVWGTSSESIYCMPSTYKDPYNPTNSLQGISGRLKQLDVGKDIVWGVNKRDDVYYRVGISDSDKKGNDWQIVGGSLKHVTVSPGGYVWGVNADDEIYYRVGASNSYPEGQDWDRISGKLVQISAGYSGVWGVNKDDNIYYREGTFGDNGEVGYDWIQVSGSLKYISSGDGYVIGVNGKNDVYIREGVTYDNPTGHRWNKIPNIKLKVIDSYGAIVYGVAPNGRVYHGDFLLPGFFA